MHSALFIEPNAQLRNSLFDACRAAGVRAVLAEGVFEAMNVLGAASSSFEVVAFPASRRALALRGMCQLARKRVPNVRLVAYLCGEANESQIRGALKDEELEVISPSSVADVARYVQHALSPPVAYERTAVTEKLGVESVEDTIQIDVTFIESMKPEFESDTGPFLAYPDKDVDAVDEEADTEIYDATQRQDLPSVLTTPLEPVSEGELNEVTGAALLTDLMVQGFSGRCECAGETLYLYGGDPVWAAHPQGPSGWLAELIEAKKVPAVDLEVDNEAQLVANLTELEHLDGQTGHRVSQHLVSSAVGRILSALDGRYAVFEDTTFMKDTPLVRVHILGLMLARARSSHTPSELLGLGREYGERRVFPTATLRSVAPRLSPFAAGRDLSKFIDGEGTCSEVWSRAGLDHFAGALLFAVLLEAKFITFDDEAPEDTELVIALSDTSSSGPVSALIDLPYAEVDPESSERERVAREQIFALYTRLKPLQTPRDVLGITVGATTFEVEAAYKKRMKDLSPERIPQGSARQLMVSRVMELREKVARAYESIQMMESPKSDTGKGGW